MNINEWQAKIDEQTKAKHLANERILQISGDFYQIPKEHRRIGLVPHATRVEFEPSARVVIDNERATIIVAIFDKGLSPYHAARLRDWLNGLGLPDIT